MIGHNGPISGVASFGSKYVATAGYDCQVILWDDERSEAIARGMHDHLANQCLFSPNGCLLATSGSDHTARLWSVPDMKLTAVLNRHDDDVEGLAFHPSVDLIATASRDHNIHIYDFGGNLIRKLLGHTADVLSLSWKRDGTLISSSDDGSVSVWDPSRGERVSTIDLGGIETDTVVVTPDGAIMAGSDDGMITVIQPDSQRGVLAHSAGIKNLSFCESTSSLMCLSYDRTLSLWSWDGALLSLKKRANFPSMVWPRSCAAIDDRRYAFSTFGSSYATFCSDTSLWDIAGITSSLSLNSVIDTPSGYFSVGDAGTVFGPGGFEVPLGSLCNFLVWHEDYLVAGGQLGQLFNVMDASVVYQHNSPLNCGISAGSRLAIGTYTGEILLFDQDHGKIQFSAKIEVNGNAIKGLAYSEGHVFAVCANGGVASIDLQTLAISQPDSRHSKIANACAALLPGSFCSVGRDLRMAIWHSDYCQWYDTPHTFSIKCCAFNDRSRTIATGDYGGTVWVFDLELKRFKYSRRVSAAGVSSISPKFDGGGFLASTYDGVVHHVDLR